MGGGEEKGGRTGKNVEKGIFFFFLKRQKFCYLCWGVCVVAGGDAWRKVLWTWRGSEGANGMQWLEMVTDESGPLFGLREEMMTMVMMTTMMMKTVTVVVSLVTMMLRRETGKRDKMTKAGIDSAAANVAIVFVGRIMGEEGEAMVVVDALSIQSHKRVWLLDYSCCYYYYYYLQKGRCRKATVMNMAGCGCI